MEPIPHDTWSFPGSTLHGGIFSFWKLHSEIFFQKIPSDSIKSTKYCYRSNPSLWIFILWCFKKQMKMARLVVHHDHHPMAAFHSVIIDPGKQPPSPNNIHEESHHHIAKQPNHPHSFSCTLTLCSWHYFCPFGAYHKIYSKCTYLNGVPSFLGIIIELRDHSHK